MKKAEKTRRKIQKTFLNLSLKRDQMPNVSEICSEMDIYRSTFYNYYSNIEELIHSVGEDFTKFLDEIFANIDIYRDHTKKTGKEFDFAEVLTPLVPVVEKNMDQFAFFLNPIWNSRYREYMMKKVYHTALGIFPAETVENRYIAEFISAGTVQYLYAHVINKEKIDVAEFRKVWSRVSLLVTSS